MQSVLITGANRGGGLALARHYHGAGWAVLGTCRCPAEEAAELGEVATQVIDGLDVTRPEDVARIARELGDQRLDLLINNAGLLQDEELDRKSTRLNSSHVAISYAV